MQAELINFKEYCSGSMVGFADLQVGGLTIRGCKLFAKEDRVWFSMPSEKRQDKEGKDVWVDVVTCSEPFSRHLQGLVRGQIRALIIGNAGGNQAPRPSHGKRGEGSDQGYQESRKAAQAGDDIPF